MFKYFWKHCSNSPLYAEVVNRHKARFQKMKDGVILYRHTNRLNFIRYADDCVPRKLGTSSNGGELVSYAA